MQDNKLIIPLKKIKADFQQFLNPEHNRRIIFSGPFGIGKTYFLNDFFEEKKDEYFSIFLRPINYSLLSNEDVFKLIKYDILVQLIQNENFKINEEFDFSNTDYLKHFLSENRFLILRNLLKAIPKIRHIIPAAEELEKLFSKYQEGIKEINKNPDLELLREFQQESENSFLLEYDEVSNYISSQLDELAKSKNKGNTKLKKVLIIDDLDRLDPEHIFRLFNVFSAHFDQVHYYENSEGNDNKFDFDKIIFVCDIENIRKIFSHKYGSEVDFSGYIDKFYSTEIYGFLHENIFEESIFPFISSSLSKLNPTSDDDFFVQDFRLVLKVLFVSHNINLRDIIRLNSIKSILIKEKRYKKVIIPTSRIGGVENTRIVQYNLLIIIKLLIDLIGDRESLVRKIKNIIKVPDLIQNFNINDHSYFINELIMFADIDNHKFQGVSIHHKFEQEEQQTYTFKFPTTQMETQYNLDGGFFDSAFPKGEVWYRLNPDANLPKLKIEQFLELLISAVEKIFKYELLN